MNYLIELGIILVAFGTYLFYLGNKKDGDKSQQIIVDKINIFSKELNKVKNDPINDLDKVSKIDELTNEFDSWAINLKENYPEIKLSYNKSELALSEKELKINKEWKPFYLEIFKNIEQMISSINKHLNKSGKIELIQNGSFPQSLFNKEEQEFDWILKFDENNFWKIYLFRYGITQEEPKLPIMQISYSNDFKKLKDNLMAKDELVLKINYDSIKYQANGSFKFIDTDKFSNEVSIKNINEILKTSIQYQLTKIDS